MTMTDSYRQEKTFGIALGVIVAIIALWPLIGNEMPGWGLIFIATLIIAAALFLPRVFTPVLKIWLPFGHLLGKLNTWLLLALIFFLLITPMALLFRLLRRDPLKLRDGRRGDYWVTRNDTITTQSFRKQF